jgi:hypothetical protein
MGIFLIVAAGLLLTAVPANATVHAAAVKYVSKSATFASHLEQKCKYRVDKVNGAHYRCGKTLPFSSTTRTTKLVVKCPRGYSVVNASIRTQQIPRRGWIALTSNGGGMMLPDYEKATVKASYDSNNRTWVARFSQVIDSKVTLRAVCVK